MPGLRQIIDDGSLNMRESQRPRKHLHVIEAKAEIPNLDMLTAIEAGGPGSGRHPGGGSGNSKIHKQVVTSVHRQLKPGIADEDLSTAEKNILGHIATAKKTGDYATARERISRELHGIDYADMTTAERNIRNLVGNPNFK